MRRHSTPAETHDPAPATPRARAAAALPGSVGWLCVALFVSGASIFGAAIQAGSRFEADAPTPASREAECPAQMAAEFAPAACRFD